MNPYLTDEERAILESVRVGIAGAGGLGSNCAMHLVRAGITKLTIADFDVVSESNLNRQFFFRDQIGMKKVEALKANLLRIEPAAEIEAIDLKLDRTNVREIFEPCDIVVEAFDQVEAKTALLAALMPSGKRLVTASGMAGWGKSDKMRTRRMGKNLVAVGDGENGVSESLPPQSPRVGIAAAMEANAVIAMLLDEEP